MLIKWENFGAFFNMRSLAEKHLTQGHFKWVSLYFINREVCTRSKTTGFETC